MGFKEINVDELKFNPFTKISRQWMLITAGDEKKINTMTASWGAMGEFWGRHAITVYIRTSRYTKEFVDVNDIFTVSFLPEDYRKALNLCGTVSGRDEDKIAHAGLTPVLLDGAPAFEEAELIIACEKLYADYMPPENFIATENDAEWYPDKDYHTLYIGGILKAFVKE